MALRGRTRDRAAAPTAEAAGSSGPPGPLGRLAEASWLAAVLVVSLAVRLLYLFALRHQDPSFTQPFGDALVYLAKATELLQTTWMGKEVFFHSSPLYMYFLAFFRKVFPGPEFFFVVRLVQVLAGSLTCVGIALYGASLFGRRQGFVAGMAAALYGPFVFFDGDLLEITLVLFFVISFLLLLELHEKRGRTGYLLLSSLCLGLSCLGKPNLLLVVPAVMLYLARRVRKAPASLSRIAVFLLPLALVILPVTVRNGIVGKDFVLVSSNAGINFYVGNNPASTGTFTLPPALEYTNVGTYSAAERSIAATFGQLTHAHAERATGRSLRSSEASRYYLRQGMELWRNDPVFAVRNTLRKAYLFLHAYEIPNHLNYYLFRDLVPPLRLAFLDFWLVMPCGLAGLWLAARGGGGGFAPWYLLTYFLSLVPFFVTARYRLPVVPVLLVFGASFAVELFRAAGALLRGAPLARAALGGAGAVFLAMLIVARMPNPLDTDAQRADAHNSLGVSLALQKRFTEAKQQFELALALKPDAAHFRMNLLVTTGDEAYFLRSGKPEGGGKPGR